MHAHSATHTLLLRPARLLTLLALLALCLAARAQGDAQLTQYWAMPGYYNPAEAGSTDWLRIRAGAKMQWVGIDNAPQSFLGTADMPFKLGTKRLGVGLALTQESLGLFSNLLLNAQVAYRFKMFGGQMSAGLTAGYYNSKFKGSKVYLPDDDDYHQGTDVAIPNKDMSGNTFDLGAGLHYSHRLFWVGLSGLHLNKPVVHLNMEGSQANDSQEYETELPRMVYLMAGGNIELHNTLFVLQPSVLVKSNLTSVTPELTLRTTCNRFLTAGIAYRLNEALSISAGAEYKNFFLGYAYDYPLSAISKASSGSHEIVVGYRLKLDFTGKNRNRQRSIRIM